MKLPLVLPDSFIRCLDLTERKKLAGGHCSAEEALSKSLAKSERELQTQIVNLLRLKGIEPLWHRTDKRSAATIGWPDITFSCQTQWDMGTTSFAWEVKFGNGKLSTEQEQMHIRLSTPPNAWRIKVIRSIDEAISELKQLGL